MRLAASPGLLTIPPLALSPLRPNPTPRAFWYRHIGPTRQSHPNCRTVPRLTDTANWARAVSSSSSPLPHNAGPQWTA
jgi:hypothetical protein